MYLYNVGSLHLFTEINLGDQLYGFGRINVNVEWHCFLCVSVKTYKINMYPSDIWLYCFRANAQQPKLFVGMILILIFAEALALYGLIVGIILSSRAGQSRAD